jgi:hypothetical protein
MENCGATVLHSPFFFLPIGVGSTNDKVQSTAKAQRMQRVFLHFAFSAPWRLLKNSSKLNRQLQLTTQPNLHNFLKC